MSAYIQTLNNSQPSLERRRSAWKAMAPFWADIDPALIDDEMCQDYREGRAVADATARYELLMLSTALNWALSKKQIAAKPAIWMPGKGDYQIRYLERDQL